MKKLIALLIISISLIGCSGNGVSSPEYTEPNRNEPTYNTPTYIEPEEKTDSNVVIDNGQPPCAIYQDWQPCSKIDTIIYAMFSSETTQSSSSITTATPCNVDGVNNCVYGSLTDSRDGQTYRTVKIGDQVWMAENLNYAYTGVPFDDGYYTSDSTSWCYDNDPANCAKYGRLYTWVAAMDSVGKWSTNGKGCGYKKTCSPTYPVRGVCPEGWHLPSIGEIETLITAVGDSYISGAKLKALTGWPADVDITNEDAFGFSALPAGRIYNGKFSYGGVFAHFWSSTESDSVSAHDMFLLYNYCYAGLGDFDKYHGVSVRCLKD